MVPNPAVAVGAATTPLTFFLLDQANGVPRNAYSYQAKWPMLEGRQIVGVHCRLPPACNRPSFSQLPGLSVVAGASLGAQALPGNCLHLPEGGALPPVTPPFPNLRPHCVPSISLGLNGMGEVL